jgi:hypothetical protein
MMTVKQPSGMNQSATVIPFHCRHSGKLLRVEERSLVRNAVLQGTAEVEHWERLLLELREQLLRETHRLEAECANLKSSIGAIGDCA